MQTQILGTPITSAWHAEATRRQELSDALARVRALELQVVSMARQVEYQTDLLRQYQAALAGRP
jgi:hypothetical protein